MHFFTLEDLVTLFESNGFIVEKTYSISLPSENLPRWIDVPVEESSLVGIKARKK